MQLEQSQRTFGDELERLLTDTDTSLRRLARLSGLSRRSLENWLYGRTPRPRNIEPILQIASALHLPAGDTNRLLLSAGYPPLEQLKMNNKSLSPSLLADWQLAPNQLLGQKSAALPAQFNLPAATTPFFGRKTAREDLATYLRRPDLRLITITGLGGSGKTRLAIETARTLVGRFDHGVYFVPLDNVHNSEGFWEAIIKGLHIQSDGVISRRQLVENYLRHKQVLLVLDNFEHLLPFTANICRLLNETQRLNLLITSQQALDLRAEQLYSIGGLSIKEGQDSPAYKLYVESARRRLPAYDPSDREAQDIVAICSAVDGLPLALELAATWSDIFTPRQILDHLQSDLQEVWHNAADRPQRQQSLWNLFDYSWRMLSEAEQEAAIRLSILRGSFSKEAGMAIADCDPCILKRLLQSSFLGRTSNARLLIHPLVRQFLEQQALRLEYDLEDLERRFIDVTLNWTAGQSRQLRKTFKTKYYQNLHREWQHIERAWWLAVERQLFDLLESCWDILFYFEARGNWGEGNNFFEETRQKIGLDNLRMQARLDEAQAIFASRFYEIPRAMKLAKHSLQTLDALGVDPNQDDAGSYARLILAAAEYQLKQAQFTEENKQVLRSATGDYLATFTAITITMADGVKACMQRDFESAAMAFKEALAICGPDAYTVPNIRSFLAIALRGAGQNMAAREQFTRAMEHALEIDIFPAVVTANYELRLLEDDKATLADCRTALEELALELGSRRTVGRVAVINAIQYLNLGMFNHAQQLTRIGLGLLWNEVDNAERRRVLSTIAQAYLAFGLIKTAPQVIEIVSPRLLEST
jgi:transcriptional regulator with XRE-family HTH domain